MRVLFELGRLLVADALRAAGAGLHALGDVVSGSDEPVTVGVPVEDFDGRLIGDEAAEMIARTPDMTPPPEDPPLKGSLVDRGSKIGQPWAR